MKGLAALGQVCTSGGCVLSLPSLLRHDQNGVLTKNWGGLFDLNKAGLL